MSWVLTCMILFVPPAEADGIPQHVLRYLERCDEAQAASVPLRLPPAKDDVGVFLPATPNDPRQGRSVDVLEVVGASDAIVRAWYVRKADRSGDNTDAEATFVDVWVQGVDTRSWVAGKPIKLEGVFHVTGNKSFGTDCGGRSVPLLEPVDIERYRKLRRP